MREARRLAAVPAPAGARPRRPRKLRAAARIEQIAERAAKVCEQITHRLAGQKITDRLVSMADPDARPIRKGKLRQPTEFGYVIQLAELSENTRRGARGLILPAATQIGSPNESDLLPADRGARSTRLGLRPREIALDGGFAPGQSPKHLPPPERVFIAGRQTGRLAQDHRRLATLPRRRRGPHQPPQTPLRPAPQPPQRPPRRPDLDRPGRSSPTTSTPSPSDPPDTIPPVRDHPPGHHPTRNGRALHPARPFSFPDPFIRGKY